MYLETVSPWMIRMYLGAVKSAIEDAFPESDVSVWAEDSIENCVIKARVDNDLASVTLFPDSRSSEEPIAQLLVALIQEQRGNE